MAVPSTAKIRAAIKALGINTPIYSARTLKGGAIELRTRSGVHKWTPPKKKPRKARKKVKKK